MSLSILLSEPITGNSTNTSLVQERMRVEPVRCATSLLRCLERCGGEVQPGEEVQRAWGGGTGHAREPVKSGGHGHRACGQRAMDRVGLLLPERVALVPRFGRADHTVDTDLAADGHTQADADHLVQQRDRVVCDVGDFKVPASSTALASDALGDGVEGDEGDVRVEHAYDLFERGEGVRVAGVDVHLVYLVCDKDDVVLLAQLDEALLLVEAENGADGVSRVNDDQRLGLDVL